jgi:ABC-type Na+ efflux pump permease subunit
MKFRQHSVLVLSTFLLATTAFLGGCASTGMKRSEKTSQSIQNVDTEIKKFIVQIDATAASLDTLVYAGKTDPKKSLESFSDSVVKFEKEGNRVTKRLDEMKANSKEYFEEWDKQDDKFTNADIRQLSSERQSKLAAIYAEVPAANAGIKGSYNAYLASLKEIQKYLSNDLTPQGIEGVKPVAQQSLQNLDQLKTSLKPVITALDQINAELYHKAK